MNTLPIEMIDMINKQLVASYHKDVCDEIKSIRERGDLPLPWKKYNLRVNASNWQLFWDTHYDWSYREQQWIKTGNSRYIHPDNYDEFDNYTDELWYSSALDDLGGIWLHAIKRKNLNQKAVFVSPYEDEHQRHHDTLYDAFAKGELDDYYEYDGEKEWGIYDDTVVYH